MMQNCYTRLNRTGLSKKTYFLNQIITCKLLSKFKFVIHKQNCEILIIFVRIQSTLLFDNYWPNQ
ncbi:hypothetical protein Mettu_1575 [Methylobacter tundripaludum SV96]|uniref:Uncharacterized protein n=1 Tax=Methylobacter tundripaludum (strain ATCC BAA-1195 / DSM 17260 / SV96) TaxID=697282 RepID=G3IUM8_METTV|nr:hypothetical protein Mettu_1575 [Methylobacter tundripaludum SV96]